MSDRLVGTLLELGRRPAAVGGPTGRMQVDRGNDDPQRRRQSTPLLAPHAKKMTANNPLLRAAERSR